jgi:hypothetical protein
VAAEPVGAVGPVEILEELDAIGDLVELGALEELEYTVELRTPTFDWDGEALTNGRGVAGFGD